MKNISLILFFFISISAFPADLGDQFASREELASLSATYIQEGWTFPENQSGGLTLSTGVFPWMTDVVVLDVTLEPARPRFLLYYSEWTGMVVRGVHKTASGFTFTVLTIDNKENPILYTVKLLVLAPGKMHIKIYDVNGHLVNGGNSEAVWLRCAPLK